MLFIPKYTWYGISNYSSRTIVPINIALQFINLYTAYKVYIYIYIYISKGII